MTALRAPGTIAAPRTPRRRSSRSNFEFFGWVFMRVSGLFLVVLVLGHLFVNLMVGDGVQAIDFAFVGGKWTDPFWQTWDMLMLWLALLHGANGLRTVINDYAERDNTRFWLQVLLSAATVLVLVLGTLTILTFDPCPPGAPIELLPSICQK